MYTRSQQTIPRANALMGEEKRETVVVHVFGSTQNDPVQNELLDALEQNGVQYEFQIDLANLSQVRQNKENQVVLLLLMNNLYSEKQIKQAMKAKIGQDERAKKVHPFAYPYPFSSSQLGQLSSIQEVLNYCTLLRQRKAKKKSIRLSGVHSINKSLSSSKQIVKLSTDSVYSTLYYYKNTVYWQQQSELYDQITDIFSKENRYCAFLDLNSMVGKQREDRNKKMLIVAPARIAEEVSKAISKKGKEDSIDAVLIGPLEPNRFYLSKSVILVTDSPARLFYYLRDKNMVASGTVSLLFEQLIKNDKYAFEGTIGSPVVHSEAVTSPQRVEVSDFAQNLIQPSPTTNSNNNEYQLVAEKVHPPEQVKHKIKKIKSPVKVRPEQVVRDDLNVGIVVKQPLAEQIKQTDEYYTNKQGQKIRKSFATTLDIATSSPNIRHPPPAAVHNYQSARQIQHYPLRHQKFRNPSNIIHETSDEYRGSNKESIVNIEAESKNKLLSKEISQAEEQTSEKRGNKMGFNQTEGQLAINSEVSRASAVETYQFQQRRQNNQGEMVEERRAKVIYQSPGKIIRKEQISQPQQVRQQSTKRIEENGSGRQSNYISSTYTAPSNTLNYYSNYQGQYNRESYPAVQSNNSSGSNGVSSSAYQQNTISSSTYRPNGLISSNLQSYYRGQSTQQQRGGQNVVKYVTSNVKVAETSNVIKTPLSPKIETTKLNLDGYERVEMNGITMYRKKVVSSEPNSNERSSRNMGVSQNRESNIESSPKVLRYEVSPIRQAEKIKQQFSSPTYGQSFTSKYTSATGSGLAYPSNYPSYNKQYVNGSTYEVGNVKIKTEERINPSAYKGNPLDSAKSEEKYIATVSYRSGGLSKDKAEVQRQQYYEQKLEAANSPPSCKALNDSNWMSKPSDLYSDGSILRRNNIRFGIKFRKKEESEASVTYSKLGSGIYTVRDLNKKMALTKKIQGEQQLQHEQLQYLHINPNLVGFHYLFEDQLKYLQKKLAPILTRSDRIDYFSCLEDLLQKAQQQMDIGLILITEQQAVKINPSLLPEDYYLIRLQRKQPCLELNENQKTIVMDSLERLTLAQKIILDKKLYQYVVCRPGKAEIEALAEKFSNTQYIVEKIEVELTWEFLDCYYYEVPQLTRLYLICQREEISQIHSVVRQYQEVNPAFQRDSLRLLCLVDAETDISGLAVEQSTTYLQNIGGLTYKDIILQVHSKDRQAILSIKADKIYIHQKHHTILKDIERQFPGRFEFYVYAALSELPKRSSRRRSQFNSYLILHQSVLGEKLNPDYFTKVFMMGRAKIVPSQVVRVMRKQELIQLLKK